MDIELYIDSVYCGFFPIEVIRSYTLDYYEKARELSAETEDDEVVIYAIFSYDPENQQFCSANFMTLAVPYDRYVRLCAAVSKNNRLFFVRKK